MLPAYAFIEVYPRLARLSTLTRGRLHARQLLSQIVVKRNET